MSDLAAPQGRHKTVAVNVGGVRVGGGAPIVVQSMTNTDTADVEATARQVAELARAGSEIVRITVDRNEAAAAVPHIKDRLMAGGVRVPIVGARPRRSGRRPGISQCPQSNCTPLGSGRCTAISVDRRPLGRPQLPPWTGERPVVEPRRDFHTATSRRPRTRSRRPTAYPDHRDCTLDRACASGASKDARRHLPSASCSSHGLHLYPG